MSIIQCTDLSGYIYENNDEVSKSLGYGEEHLSHEIVGIKKVNINNKVRFKETIEAISDKGMVNIEKLTSKYSLKTPYFGSCF